MLPKMTYPIYDAIIPSVQKRVKFRPMTVKEEKILMTAAEGREDDHVFNAVRQVVHNCLIENTHALTVFDIEYLFIRIRIVSVGNTISVTYRDNDDQQSYDFEIDLEKVEVKFNKEADELKKIEVNGLKLNLNYPKETVFDKIKPSEDLTAAQYLMKSLAACIDSIEGPEGKTIFENASEKEQQEFIESLDSKTYEKIKKFFEKVPTLHYQIEYQNSNGKDRKIVMDTLSDFFTLG